MIHTTFDILASLASLTVTALCCRWRLSTAAQKIEHAGTSYIFALIIGAVVGGYGLGTLNLYVSGHVHISRSILGALAGAITSIELFKWSKGLTGSTGLIFVPAFASTIIVGRWGCFLSGLADETHGTQSSLPWAVDLGDGITRHPVQLYEALSMLAFLSVALALMNTRNPWFARNGFYALVLFYATQRFLWEFLKPYAAILGPFNLFHLVCTCLIAYALVMMGKSNERATS
jgi:phosphatidylglycerol---prolipoprotein diacylglyceryl transferase